MLEKWLSAPTVPIEDPSLSPNICIRQVTPCLTLAPWGTVPSPGLPWHLHICVYMHTHMHLNKYFLGERIKQMEKIKVLLGYELRLKWRLAFPEMSQAVYEHKDSKSPHNRDTASDCRLGTYLWSFAFSF